MSKQLTRPFNPLPWYAGPHDFTGADNLGRRTNDIAQRFNFGTRSMSWDGSVYRYCKASTTYTSYQAAVWHTATGAGISFEAINSGSAAGSKEVIIAEAGITEDQYAGGYLLIFHSSGNGMITSVIGNTASEGGIVVLYLDEPLPVAITAEAIELYANPWSAVSQGGSNGLNGFIGIPQALLTTNYHGWVKTWGPVFISAQSTIGDVYVKACYFRHDGSIDARGNIGTPVTDQYAGYVMVGKQTGDGPLIMLQVSI